MLTQQEKYIAQRLGYKVLSNYRFVYYRINGNIPFPADIKEIAQAQIVGLQALKQVRELIEKNKDVKNVQEFLNILDSKLEELRVKIDLGVKEKISEYEEASPKKKVLLNRNASVTKPLARFIGMNVQPKLLKKKDFLENQEAGQCKKYIAVNQTISNLLEEYKQKTENMLNEYVSENIDELVKKTILVWDQL